LEDNITVHAEAEAMLSAEDVWPGAQTIDASTHTFSTPSLYDNAAGAMPSNAAPDAGVPVIDTRNRKGA